MTNDELLAIGHSCLVIRHSLDIEISTFDISTGAARGLATPYPARHTLPRGHAVRWHRAAGAEALHAMNGGGGFKLTTEPYDDVAHHLL